MKKYAVIGTSVFIIFFSIISSAMAYDSGDVVLYGLAMIATINATVGAMIVDELKKLNKK